MRWLWIDTFVEFVPGEKAVAIKNVTLAEDHMHDHFPGCPIFPPTLMIEGMAQTAGILVGQAREFRENVILAKIRKAIFTDYAVPGQQLRYDATLDMLDDRAATTRGVVSCNQTVIGSVDLMFSHVNNSQQVEGLPTHQFVFTEQFMSLLGRFTDLNPVGASLDTNTT